MTYRASIVPLRDPRNTVYIEYMQREHFTSRDWKHLQTMALSLAAESIDYDRLSISVVNVDTNKLCFQFHAFTRFVDGCGLCDSRIICDIYACGSRFNHIRTAVLAE